MPNAESPGLPIHLTIHGAAGTVTGSCHQVEQNGVSLLVDCGLFQGPRTLEALNREPFAFDQRRIDAVDAFKRLLSPAPAT